MSWVRVASTITHDSKVDALSDRCAVRVAEAVGLIVGVLTHLPAEARDGDISAVSDRLIERWGGWEGERGVFASAFRALMCDEKGVVRAWEKHNGAALRRMENDLERKRSAKAQRDSAEFPQTVPQNFRRSSAVDETRRDGTVPTTTLDDDRSVVRPTAVDRSIWDKVAPVVGARGHGALRKLLSAVPDADAWAAIIHGYASGLSADRGRPASPERLAQALEDYVAQGHHQKPNPSLFRGFVKRAKEPEPSRYAHQQTAEERNAEILHDIRAYNDRQRAMGTHGAKLKPIPTWAPQIDAMFPDGRTWPRGIAA